MTRLFLLTLSILMYKRFSFLIFTLSNQGQLSQGVKWKTDVIQLHIKREKIQQKAPQKAFK